MPYVKNSTVDEVPDPYFDNGSGFDLVLDYIKGATSGLLANLKNETVK